MGDRADARPGRRGLGHLARRRLEPGGVPRVAPPGRGVEAGRVPVAPGAAAARLPAVGRPAGAARGVARPGARRRPGHAGVLGAAAARRADAPGPGVGADRHPHLRLRRAGDPGRRARRHGAGPPRRRGEPHPRATPLAAGAARPALTTVERGTARAAWWFFAPALAVIGVFFFLPVLASLALSFTDFDIYAIADLRNLRLVGLRNYVELLQRPLFWQALGNTLYFVVVGVPLSIAISLGSALLLHSR